VIGAKFAPSKFAFAFGNGRRQGHRRSLSSYYVNWRRSMPFVTTRQTYEELYWKDMHERERAVLYPLWLHDLKTTTRYSVQVSIYILPLNIERSSGHRINLQEIKVCRWLSFTNRVKHEGNDGRVHPVHSTLHC
jgi:hypothetical protein